MSAIASTPAQLAALRTELQRHAPFGEMDPADVTAFIDAASEVSFEPGQVVLEPAAGQVLWLYFVRRGAISGRRGIADGGALQYEAGDLFPIGAVLRARPVSATYTADEACVCWRVPAAVVLQLAQRSAPFADFLHRRVLHLFELSQRAMQSSYASQTLAEQSLESPLRSLPRRDPLACFADTPLAEALERMHARGVGSIVVTDGAGSPTGILTRHDVLSRVTLAALPLATPIGRVMSAPVFTLETHDTLQDAALLMAARGIRHVPVCEAGRLVDVVSERDLFALQRLSLGHLSDRVRAARTLDDFRRAAADIRRFARNLLGQGVHAAQLTELISRLNDVLTATLVETTARELGLDPQRFCWLAFGSEGRSEQTVATDQDNGLVFASEAPARDRAAWLRFGAAVNQALDACGYPLCKGNVMAGNPACCLTAAEWAQRFGQWVDHGAPEDLLNASIYFDLRAIAGNTELAGTLRTLIATEPAGAPRFIKQMADNALRNRAPLNWRGAIETRTVDGREMFDLKMRGTAIFVDAARLYALAHGVAANSTRARLAALTPALGVPSRESEAWIGAFEFLQMLRLRVQLQPGGTPVAGAPNLIDLATLNDLDRKLLKESLRVAKTLQQRIELDYGR